MHLDKIDLALLDSVISKTRTVAAHVDLISEGEKPSDVHLVLQGFACRYKILQDGRRQIMAYLVPGDICDLHVFLLDHMDHSLGTLSTCEIVDLPRTVVLELLDRPNIARGLLLSTMVDEGTLREWLVNIGQREAEPRVAHLLCELLARLRSVGLVSDQKYTLPLTQVELADTMGMTPVHMNRVLQSLRRKALISLESNQLTVLNSKRLESEAGWNPNYLHLRKVAAAAAE
ncbi:Crp/Fnr family transcriptional regulator [Mesorhizobium sp. YC-39]|uniref:Crp/Fnr family transcriptional regulator n=1 Tax=unclassified Mesorhizobium TaxID=325217 RepID=UPI0021E8C899|nr:MULTISPECIES: Crp/Fnr family transcriptional regulator [unclassified Mesorhizobium]MCV3209987.1 Crp/Fnr family transcriptional regulator [Mesorhizobium sp. YC-2]MCV3230517.1 Crp/Fnr family transcriptional regulator [Mesorhizobium sp. YC-39]